MKEESPLDMLAQQVLAAKANREALEEELEHTPVWRFRRRSRLQHRFQHRLHQEKEMLALVKQASRKSSSSEG